MTQPNNIHHLQLNLPQDRMPEHVIVTMRFSPIVRLSTLLEALVVLFAPWRNKRSYPLTRHNEEGIRQ